MRLRIVLSSIPVSPWRLVSDNSILSDEEAGCFPRGMDGNHEEENRAAKEEAGDCRRSSRRPVHRRSNRKSPTDSAEEAFFQTKVTGTAKTHVTGTGTMNSHFAIPQTGRLCVRPTGGDLKLKATVTSTGTPDQVFEVPFHDSLFASRKNILMSYSCRGNELIIEEIIGVGADHSNVRYDFHYRKLP